MRQTILSGVMLLLATIALETRAAEQAENTPESLAREFVTQLAQGDYREAVSSFDSKMSHHLPEDKLQKLWEGISGQWGEFQEIQSIRLQKVPQYQITLVTCHFEKGLLDVKVVFTANQQIAGLFFLPAGRYQSPSYVKPNRFKETEVTIGTGLWSLPGTLSVPVMGKKVPAVVLVHGSGPQDRNETTGPNQPFRDLAEGLASQGIAVLRYEKRTKHHRLKMVLLSGSLTVREETIDDAVAAVQFLQSQARIDRTRVFVLGHSLGGYLLPQLGAEAQGIAGLISLAGSARPLEEIVLEQMKYLSELNGEAAEESEQKLQELEKQVAMVKSLELKPETPAGQLPLGIPASYWLALRGYDAAERARTLQVPLLILQGQRDYQVTMDDFARWKQALRNRKDVRFISYPKLNHLFMAGEGPGTPAEYMIPGNVAEEVVRDIAAWIDDQK
ncbi:Alpha/beta hydrolase family protein [Gimesia maris]|uniref:alpha/beta hydrolase n=1 Tax=Gimesia maris TaxID=122 RepID=UPI0011885BAF|nr:alpha/beta fold hydrolase [Gimesia maris]QDT77868.1 Alpha/beta hydrolase family protein [Gimesia maris]